MYSKSIERPSDIKKQETKEKKKPKPKLSNVFDKKKNNKKKNKRKY